MNGIIDLHMHSTYSDGELEPIELLHLCNEKNVKVMSITDHNMTHGCKEAINNNPYSNITIIPGIEFSAKYELKGGQLHILGYNMDLENSALNEIIENLREENVTKIKALLYLVKKYYNFTFKDEDVQKIFNKKGNIGRPEVAKLCVSYGYTKSSEHAFSEFLEPIDDMLPKKRFKLSAKECINYITSAGGIACLAHAITLKKDDENLESFVKTLMSYGLRAIEAHHSKHSITYQEKLLTLAEKLGLLVSVGSDFHGKVVTPNIQIGSGDSNNLNVEEATILTEIMR